VSVDWGARARHRGDVVLGGLTGIVLAASFTAAMSLIVVAATVTRMDHEVEWLSLTGEPIPLSFRWGIYRGLGGVAGGTILILFGLAALAPACYSVCVYGQKLSIHWPRLRQSGWIWLGGGLALVGAATSFADRLEWIYSAMGDFFAPAIGALAADWLRQRGRWPGLRHGINGIGVVAWAAGFGVTLVLEVDRVVDPAAGDWLQPTSIYGFITAAAVYWLLGRMGRARVLGRLTPA
jgi:cytosine permease